jgi:hypothetical protein
LGASGFDGGIRLRGRCFVFIGLVGSFEFFTISRAANSEKTALTIGSVVSSAFAEIRPDRCCRTTTHALRRAFAEVAGEEAVA